METIRVDEASDSDGGSKGCAGSKNGGDMECLREEVIAVVNALRDLRKEVMESFQILKSFTCVFKEVFQQMHDFRDQFNSKSARKPDKET